MANHKEVTSALSRARASVQEASRIILKSAEVDWDRSQWEEVLVELGRLDTTYDELVGKFGRRYLSKVTGKRVTSARGAILEYLRLNLGTPVNKERLKVIAGIGEWARRVRELRVEKGWPIRVTPGVNSTYCLTDVKPDPAAKKRWKELNEIRRIKISPQDRILTLLRKRIGTPVSVSDIEYVANVPTWKDELLKLRFTFGYKVSSSADRPELSNEYLLESDELIYDHDEWVIPDELREKVLEADHRTCTSCGWEQDTSDEKWMEVHRRSPGNELKDFASLCNMCHDRLHLEGPRSITIRLDRKAAVRVADWQAFFEREVPKDLTAVDAGREVQRLLLASARIGGHELPLIREMNALRDNPLWSERVNRVLPVLRRRFGATWYTKTGLALHPPLQGKAGDGFEQLTKFLIRRLTAREALTHVPLEQVFPGRHFADVRQIDVFVPDPERMFLSLKWSLRGDRTHQVQLEARTLKQIQPSLFFAVVTNEYDLGRLKPLLDDPAVSAVYHVDKVGVEAMWKPELDSMVPLQNLRDLTDLIRDLGAD